MFLLRRVNLNYSTCPERVNDYRIACRSVSGSALHTTLYLWSMRGDRPWRWPLQRVWPSSPKSSRVSRRSAAKTEPEGAQGMSTE